MNGREALKALADGKRIARPGYGSLHIDSEQDEESVSYIVAYNDWVVVEEGEEPATDEELSAEMERLANTRESFLTPEGALEHCARMLRARKVTP